MKLTQLVVSSAVLVGSALAQDPLTFTQINRVCENDRLLRAVRFREAVNQDWLDAVRYCSSLVYARTRTSTITLSFDLGSLGVAAATVTDTSTTTLPDALETTTTSTTSTSSTTTTTTSASATLVCGAVHVVALGDTCYSIYVQYGLSFNQLRDLNPGINRFCSNLALGASLCVGVLLDGGNPTTTTTTTTTTSTSGTITSSPTLFIPKARRSDAAEPEGEYCVDGENVAPVARPAVWQAEPVNRVQAACSCIMWRDVSVHPIQTVLLSPSAIRVSVFATADPTGTSTSRSVSLITAYRTITVSITTGFTTTPSTSVITTTTTSTTSSVSLITLPTQTSFRAFSCGNQDAFAQCCVGAGILGTLVGLDCKFTSLPSFPSSANHDETGDGGFDLTHDPCTPDRAVPLCCSELLVSIRSSSLQRRPPMADTRRKSPRQQQQVPAASYHSPLFAVPLFPCGKRAISLDMCHGFWGVCFLLHLFAGCWLCSLQRRVGSRHGRDSVPTTLPSNICNKLKLP
ncbi:hypothetical protein B0T21DRAFT_176661 [Apiosordaria backusii]|uniref:LysM domain-containing protein n=1 Tax=Apiosordaria backusii TaxID=314023 RepID=A0AA40EDS6_9PEZI|nr:hypothetical protein B0T21DRAFT_176661 [Apiosordaria backusii]